MSKVKRSSTRLVLLGKWMFMVDHIYAFPMAHTAPIELPSQEIRS